MPRDPDIATAIMRNARAAWREQLRNQVRLEQPALDGDGVEARVDQLVSEARSAAGRRGAAQSRRAALAARNTLERVDDLVGMARALLAAIEALGDPTRDCPHEWPGCIGGSGDYCARCGLAWADHLDARAVAA